MWPVLIVVAILIKIKMPGGPALFTQKRVGRHGKLFTMHKFRSMTVSHSGSSVSVAGEARITPLGAKLRKYKLDELPELWDVLIGNMSFVGPRPEVEKYTRLYTEEQGKVLSVRPGITDWASIKYLDENVILGKAEDPAYATASTIVAEMMGEKLGADTVVCGGDTTGFVENLQEEHPNLKYSLVSTGGGAALEFLLGKELPGIAVLETK